MEWSSTCPAKASMMHVYLSSLLLLATVTLKMTTNQGSDLWLHGVVVVARESLMSWSQKAAGLWPSNVHVIAECRFRAINKLTYRVETLWTDLLHPVAARKECRSCSVGQKDHEGCTL